MFGKSSKFYNENYDSGLINDTFGDDVMTELSFSCASLGGECDEPELLRDKILETVELYKANGFDENEFMRIKKSYFGSFIRTFNNVDAIGNLVCRNYLNDIDIMAFPEIYSSITSESLRTVLDEVFNEDTCVLSVVKPID